MDEVSSHPETAEFDPTDIGWIEIPQRSSLLPYRGQVEYGTSAKFLELLKEIAPRVTRAAVLRDPAIPRGIGQFAVIQPDQAHSKPNDALVPSPYHGAAACRSNGARRYRNAGISLGFAMRGLVAP